MSFPLSHRHLLWAADRCDLGRRVAAAAQDRRTADPRARSARPTLLRDDAWHGNGVGRLTRAKAECRAPEKRHGQFDIPRRHVSHRSAAENHSVTMTALPNVVIGSQHAEEM